MNFSEKIMKELNGDFNTISNISLIDLEMKQGGFSYLTGNKAVELLQSVAHLEPQTLPFDIPSNFTKASTIENLLILCAFTGDSYLSRELAQEVVDEVEERQFVQWMKQF